MATITDPFSVQKDIPIPEFKTYIPEWADDPSPYLDYEVMSQGLSLGFHVKDVVPWRRWAIDFTTANEEDKSVSAFDQLEFQDRLYLYRRKGLNSQGEIVELDRIEPRFEAVPTVEDWLTWTIDRNRRPIKIGFDPMKGQDVPVQNVTPAAPIKQEPKLKVERHGNWYHAVTADGEVVRKGNKEAIEKFVAQ